MVGSLYIIWMFSPICHLRLSHEERIQKKTQKSNKIHNLEGILVIWDLNFFSIDPQENPP